MRRSKRTVKKLVESSDSEDEIPLKKLHISPKVTPSLDNKRNDESSSESDIENYLQPIDKIDLNSSFFKTQSKNEFEKLEEQLFSGITRLTDSESDECVDEDLQNQDSQGQSKEMEVENQPSTSGTKLNFKQLEEYTRQIEEAKKQVEKYNAKKKAAKKAEENTSDISNLLAIGESKKLTLDNIREEDLHSSDFESCDSEREDWEEVNESHDVKESTNIPKQGLEIVVNMPDHCRKKKGVDLVAAMKRRLNRIRKENQVYVHKVHLLCWIAHGNYVNECINNTETLALALSLLPSEKCYPSDRTDLGYLEQIVQWYKKTIKILDKPVPKKSLVDVLKSQISKKEVYNKKMFVYIFIAILRALGIQCRLVLSFQVEPLRPPAHELHSLAKDGAKKEEKGKAVKEGKDTVTKKEKGVISAKSTPKSEKHSTDTKIEPRKTVNKKMKSNSSTATKAKDKSETVKDNSTSDKGKGKDEVKDAVESKSRKKSSRGISDKSDENKSAGTSKSRTTRQDAKDAGKGKEKKAEQSSGAVKKAEQSSGAVKKEILKVKLPVRKKKDVISQVDGADGSSDEECFVLQLDGADDDKKSTAKKPNLKKLHNKEEPCKRKKHPARLKSLGDEYNSEDDFSPRTPFDKKNTGSPKLMKNSKVNLQNLKAPKRSENAKDKPQNLKVNLQKLKSPKTSETVTDKPQKRMSPLKKQMDVKNDIMNLIKGRIVEQKHIDKSRRVKKRAQSYKDSDSDSDFAPEPVKKKHHNSDGDIDYFVPKPKVKRRVQVPKKESETNILNKSDGETGSKKKGNNVWAEVFLESEEKWISVDVVFGQVHCVNELYTRASHPISYIVAWNNNSTIKDITKRYCTNFNTITRKLRIEQKWWDESLKPFTGKYTARDREEDDDLNRQQLDQPLPKSIAEYKNHPLYALQRHLLKFEALYPPDVQPLGFVRGEAVYPRNCVYVCHSRDIWLKEAKVVKPGEKPYKIVKARPKYDKLSNTIITDQLLEIFGKWQTMDYEPPTAENGVVPRNAFGNVELFKACMLPKGTVHLKLPGLNKVCRRMNIDCASAIVGFDFHSGWSHPMYDGFVVCEEFADVVVAAWEVEQDELEKKENEKIEKRVYGNWKKLIKGLLIRERLKAKYDFGQAGTSKDSTEKKPKGPKFCTKKR